MLVTGSSCSEQPANRQGAAAVENNVTTRRTAAVRGKSRSLTNLTAIRHASSISSGLLCGAEDRYLSQFGIYLGISGLSGARGVVAGWGSLIRVGGDCMRAFVSDQSSSFNAVDIGTAPDLTIVASLKLPPGEPGWCLPRWRWVPLPAPPVRLPFRCSFSSTVTSTALSPDRFHHLGSIWHHQRFSGCPLHHGIGARHAENSAGRVCCD